MNHSEFSPEQLARQAQQQAIRRRRYRKPKKTHYAASLFCAVSATQKSGQIAEELACHYLTKQGLQILARNLKCQVGEIDIVAKDGNTLVFIEVRNRNNLKFGSSADSVNNTKQRKLSRAASFWLPHLTQHYFTQTPRCRFDMVACDAGQLLWIKDAFQSW